jgi:hypothetical protein
MKQKEICMEMDLQKVDYFKVIALLKTFKGRSVQINVIGSIVIPFWIEEFDWVEYEDEIMFGEFEDETVRFYIEKDGLDAWNVYDAFLSDDRLIFKIEFDIFTTWVEIICSLEGIEMYE